MDISSSLTFVTDDFGYKRVLGLGWDKGDGVVSRADTPADCGVLSLLRVVQALLSQVGPPSRT